MNLRTPTFAELREILVDVDAGLALELDAFNGIGQWTADTEAARLAAIARDLPSHVHHDDAGRPVAAMGITLVRPGVVQTWFTARAGWQAHNQAIAAIHAGMRDRLFTAGGIHRSQAYSLAGRPRVRSWFEWLGYTHEGVQVRAGAQREDLDVYGLTSGGEG